jgi:predicted nucleic acid-binding protein
MRKIMFDTNEFDKLLECPGSYDDLLRLLAEGKIELLSTHIQRDEILATPDTVKKARLEELLTHARMIETRGIVLDISRCDQARYGSDEDHRLIEHIRGTNWERDSKDALIAATAARDADVFVTEDKRLMQRLSSYPGIQCEVIDFTELQRRLAD